MIIIVIYKLDITMIKSVKTLIRKFFHDNDRDNIIKYKISVVQDEQVLFKMFAYKKIDILMLSANEDNFSCFEKTNLCILNLQCKCNRKKRMTQSQESDTIVFVRTTMGGGQDNESLSSS